MTIEKMTKMIGKRGIYFTVDSIIAVSIIFLTLYLVASSYQEEQQEGPTYQKASDLVKVLSSVRVGELNSSYVQALITNGTIVRANNTILEQMGEFWANNQGTIAEEFISSVADGIVSSQFGVSILLDGEEMFLQDKQISEVLISSRKIITGIAKDKPTEGFTSKAFLTSIQEKKNYAYAYFGGFVGQGNITTYLEDIPSTSVVRSLDIEVDSGSSFNLFINNVQCQSTFTPGIGEMTADHWNISACISSLYAGQQNNITLFFDGSINTAYLGGGFVRATYTTDVLDYATEESSQLIMFPKISGIINLYSSFYVPGTLNSMNLSLHYSAISTNVSNNTLYVAIGNKTVAKIKNASGEGWIWLNDSNLSAQLSYAELSEKTVPIRVGFENVSFSSYFFGNADVGLITDVSGSMDWRMNQDGVNGVLRNCNDTTLGNGDTRRISVAKCLDIQFSKDIINTSGNRIGLISFDDTTQSTVALGTNFTVVNQTIGTSVPLTGYNPGGGTCICCGINSAKGLLTAGLGNITLIASRSSNWLFTNKSFYGTPEQDPSGREWYEVGYANESQWTSGASILGATNGFVYTPTITTEMGVDLLGNALDANFWEYGGDVVGPPADFTSNRLNMSGSDYGISGAHDGWDKDQRDGAGPFGNDDDIDYNNISSGRLEFDNNFGGGGNVCSSNDCSAAYGISLNITQGMYDILQSGGSSLLSFSYEWEEVVAGNTFEVSDEVWVKARWTSPSSGQHMLGTNADTGHTGSDGSVEIHAEDDGDNDFSGFYSSDIKQWIEGPGVYYLEIGGKILANDVAEHGTWRFDNVRLLITNSTNNYYLRKHFTVSSLSQVRKGVMNVLSDDYAQVYLNGNLIDTDVLPHSAKYWNRHGKNILGDYFVQGDNVIAVHLTNINNSAKFDLELIGLNDSREKAMIVMSDGQATEDGPCPQSGTPAEEAIEAACQAREDYGITVYAVGFSNSADNDTMRAIAECGDGLFTQSDNTVALQDFYDDVAQSIVSLSRHAQTVELTGELSASVLYGDSYIGINYSPQVSPAQFGEIALNFEEKNFQNCTFNVSIPAGVRVTDAKLTSYSSEHWTDGLMVNGVTVYNLSEYNFDYTALGDPFAIMIPPASLASGNNILSIRTGDSPENSTGCSLNNTFIYSGAVSSSVSYTDVLKTAVGCRWSVETESSILAMDVPLDYAGSKLCSYTSSNISYDGQDGTDVAVYNLLRGLDFDLNGRINIDVSEQDLQIESIFVEQVPSLWGPTIAEVRVWQ
jgi:hypothetical protein